MRESGSGRPCAARSDEGLRWFVMAVVSSLVFDVNVLIINWPAFGTVGHSELIF